MFAIIAFVIWDAVFTSPEHRLIQPDFSQKFLVWVQSNPLQGLLAFLFVIAFAVVFMIPIGTPLTLGCGYIYKGAYGWKLGLTVATIVSMAGSALGAVVCFLLGRYLMRDQVRQWIKKYPLFVAIDIGKCRACSGRRACSIPRFIFQYTVSSHTHTTLYIQISTTASAEHGLKIMAMLYLTPVLPLGPVSYMCGTTSMLLSHFVLAKVASLPLMLLYCFIGASTGALLTNSSDNDSVKSIENNESLIISGIGMSFVMIALITRQVKKELNKILERQKKGGKGPEDEDVEDPNQASALELSNRGNLARHRKREP